MVWTHGENGGTPVSEKNSRICCKMCEDGECMINDAASPTLEGSSRASGVILGSYQV